MVELRPGELRFLRVAWELELDYMREALSIGNEKR
nr:MAG TPA: hypothetical protein [Caudoviricetes sp.]